MLREMRRTQLLGVIAAGFLFAACGDDVHVWTHAEANGNADGTSYRDGNCEGPCTYPRSPCDDPRPPRTPAPDAGQEDTCDGKGRLAIDLNVDRPTKGPLQLRVLSLDGAGVDQVIDLDLHGKARMELPEGQYQLIPLGHLHAFLKEELNIEVKGCSELTLEI